MKIGKSKSPLYVELYEQIKKMIQEGKYLENEKLPSKRKLGASLKISPLTVDAAYQQLIAEGYVYSIEKSGYYVSKQVEVLENIKKEKYKVSYDTNKKAINYQYEFKTNVVDTSLFPNATWAKLSREVLSENHHEMLNITNPKGMEPLRKEIAKYLELYRGMKVNEEQIIIGSGTTSLISMLIEILGRNKHYAIEDPGYSKIYHLYKGNDVELSLVPVDDGGLRVDALIQSKAEIVHITPSHQFPTGVVMPIQRRSELLNWAISSNNHYIIEDDYDSEFRFQGKPIPALQGLDEHQKVIYMNTFTKTLAPSFRMSYMVLPEKLLNDYQEISSHHGCTVPNFEQYIMYKFMHGGYFERHINRMKNHYRQKIDIILKTLQNEPHLQIKGHETGLHFLMTIDTDKSEKEIIEEAKQHEINVSGLSMYYMNQKNKNTKPTLVIGYSGIKTQDINLYMSKLITLLK
jgi:GntR family transcriptional regulator / MocR family aminotransferase